mmetsp:Transcript_20688/g.58927  ORF Transcript_20688/g.58927 Transcript_20688/m.58927 type:complete len:223 (+) Transcript_20688:423-1091(+)
MVTAMRGCFACDGSPFHARASHVFRPGLLKVRYLCLCPPLQVQIARFCDVMLCFHKRYVSALPLLSLIATRLPALRQVDEVLAQEFICQRGIVDLPFSECCVYGLVVMRFHHLLIGTLGRFQHRGQEKLPMMIAVALPTVDGSELAVPFSTLLHVLVLSRNSCHAERRQAGVEHPQVAHHVGRVAWNVLPHSECHDVSEFKIAKKYSDFAARHVTIQQSEAL